MKLVLLGEPYLYDDCIKSRRVLVNVDQKNNTVMVDSAVDIVTLGVAVEVLQEQYDQYLDKLDKKIAEEIRATIRKVVHNETN